MRGTVINIIEYNVKTRNCFIKYVCFSPNSSVSKDAEEVLAEPMNDNELPGYMEKRLMMRRGSKSLPASPLGSPKSMRRSQNPYFTATFTVNPPNGSSDSTRGWLLSSLLGMHRDTMSSTTSIASSHIEESDEAHTSSGQEKSSTATQRPIKARPSELREMNFWTPTST